MTWPAYERMNALYEQTYGVPLSMSGHNFTAPEPAIWRSIVDGVPYPTKALITWGSNPLLNAANTKLVYRALKSPNLDLHVVLEHFMTPTAMLADYVLPAASKLERGTLSTMEDFTSVFVAGERACNLLASARLTIISSANSPFASVLARASRGRRKRSCTTIASSPRALRLRKRPRENM